MGLVRDSLRKPLGNGFAYEPGDGDLSFLSLWRSRAGQHRAVAVRVHARALVAALCFL